MATPRCRVVGHAPAAAARENALSVMELTEDALVGVWRSPVSRLFTFEGWPIRPSAYSSPTRGVHLPARFLVY